MPVSKAIISTTSTADSTPKSLIAVNAKVESSFTFEVSKIITGTVQVAVNTTSGSGTRSLWSVRVSNDGLNFSALAPELTVSAGGITDIIDLTGFMYMQVSNASANGGAVSTYTTETVNIVVCTQT